MSGRSVGPSQIAPIRAASEPVVHPVNGEAVRCTAPLPEDMQQLMKTLRADSIEHAELGRR